MGENGHDIRVGSNSQESGDPYGELTVEDYRYGTTQIERTQNAVHGSAAGSPRYRGPADVCAPTSAEDAASGDHRNAETLASDYRTLEVAGQFAYRIEVSGDIRPAEEHAKWLWEGDAYGDDWAEWWLSGSDSARTVWMFTGDITSLDISDRGGVTEVRTLAVDGGREIRRRSDSHFENRASKPRERPDIHGSILHWCVRREFPASFGNYTAADAI